MTSPRQASLGTRESRLPSLLVGIFLFLFLAVAGFLVLNNASSGAANPANGAKSVSGLLTDVIGPADGSADRVRLRDGNGSEWTFAVSEKVLSDAEHPTSVKHLRLHLTSRQPVTVWFRDTPAGPLADRITDAAN